MLAWYQIENHAFWVTSLLSASIWVSWSLGSAVSTFCTAACTSGNRSTSGVGLYHCGRLIMRCTVATGLESIDRKETNIG